MESDQDTSQFDDFHFNLCLLCQNVLCHLTNSRSDFFHSKFPLRPRANLSVRNENADVRAGMRSIEWNSKNAGHQGPRPAIDFLSSIQAFSSVL
jgi:hypothetical protein